jgi:hypothetical protein
LKPGRHDPVLGGNVQYVAAQQKTLAPLGVIPIIEVMLQRSKANNNNSVQTARSSQQPSTKPFSKV